MLSGAAGESVAQRRSIQPGFWNLQTIWRLYREFTLPEMVRVISLNLSFSDRSLVSAWETLNVSQTDKMLVWW